MTEVRVKVRTGTLVGRKFEGFVEFLGVPYAMPPTGAAAFLPPTALEASDEVISCTAYGASAPRPNASSGFTPEPVIEGPNYLNLNVWTPVLGGAGLPVFVWIHGGGFTGGSNASPWYRGANFARDGVVAIAINYRLGPEGFLRISDENANRGLLDMIAALSWIQENVAALGGDPGRVTIGGQSAGASACLALFTSPKASGLFWRTAIQSSGGMTPASLPEAVSMAEDFASNLGVDLDPEQLAAVPSGRRREADLRYLPSAVGRRPIWEGVAGDRAFGKESLTWRPTLDGTVIAGDTYSRARSGLANCEALLIGSTAEEFNGLVAAAATEMSEDEMVSALVTLGLSSTGIEEYLTFGRGRGSLPWAFGQAFTDWRMRIPAAVMADASTAGGVDVFKYEFRFAARLPGPGAHRVQHSSDIPFVFDNLDAEGVSASVGEDAPQGLADEMHGAWVQFLEGAKEPWPRYEPAGGVTMIFEAGSRLQSTVGLGLRALWGESPGSTVPAQD
jgi:para-nitrobenzyl esterase